MYGIGYSIIRINKDGSNTLYEYTAYHRLPEEVYIHEFLHSLERLLQDREYEIPQLHDYAKYGYQEDNVEGLKDWYADYMAKNITEPSTGKKVGLYKEVYTMQPYHSSDFENSEEIEFHKEPENIFDEIKTIFGIVGAIFKR